MNKKILYTLVFLSCALSLFTVVRCSQTTKPLEKPRLAAMVDTTVFANDTVRLFAKPVVAPDSIALYVWSMGAGSPLDTTFAPFIDHVWTMADSGIHHVWVKITDARRVVSDSVVITITVRVCRPIILLTGDSLVFANDSNRYFISNSGSCAATWYFWSFDGGKTFIDTTFKPMLTKRWSEADTNQNKIVAFAKTQSGIPSFTDTLPLKVVSCKPTVRLSGALEAFPLDTTRYSANGFSNCYNVTAYTWSFDRGVSFKDTGKSNFMVKQWSAADTGLRPILVKALTSSGLASSADSLIVRVRSDSNPIQLPSDTNIASNDTVAISARLMSRASTAARFFWTIDHSAQEVPTLSNTLKCFWPLEQTGVHSVKVRATDIRMSSSISDSMTINVYPQKPTIVPPRDTLLSRTDTAIFSIKAFESGATIAKYFWNINGLSWTDSSALAQQKIAYLGIDTLSVGIGVRDNRGTTVTDSFHIYYNAPPEKIRMIAPLSGDTVRFRTIDSTFARGQMAFTFSAFDKNGKSDSLVFSLYLGKSPTALTKIYQGRDSVFTASKLDTAQYYWRLTARDKFGDSAFCIGSFTTLLERTICFAGHSIVAGFGGDDLSGGFRKKVLAGMRNSFGGTAKVKPIGPLTTNIMKPVVDDSCLAVGGYTSKQVLALLTNSFPGLNADNWVLMLGVNGGYYFPEIYYLMNILDIIHNNNPKAGIYIINGLPYQPSYGQDKVFNGWLADSIAAKKSRNWNISQIDGFSKFAINDTPNPALFTPESPALLHPNQAGYDTLANMILNTMGIQKR